MRGLETIFGSQDDLEDKTDAMPPTSPYLRFLPILSHINATEAALTDNRFQKGSSLGLGGGGGGQINEPLFLHPQSLQARARPRH